MKKGLLSILASALLVVGCQNYDDQFTLLENQITALSQTVSGLSQVQSTLASLSGTVNSLSSTVSGLGDAIDTAVAEGLADIQEDITAIEAAVADVASSDAVADLADAVAASQEDLDDLLATSSVFSGAVIINNQSTLDAFYNMGVGLAIVNGSVDIDVTADMDIEKVQSVVNNILTTTGAYSYNVAGATVGKVTFNNLSGTQTLTVQNTGAYMFKNLVSAGNITLMDTYQSKVDTVHLGKLTTVTSLSDGTANQLDFDAAEEMHLSSLAYYGGDLTLHTKKGGVLDISSLTDTNLSDVVAPFDLSIDGPASVTVTGIKGDASATDKGAMSFTNVGTVAVSNFGGTITIGTGVDAATLEDVATSPVFTAADDLTTVSIEGVTAYGKTYDVSGTTAQAATLLTEAFIDVAFTDAANGNLASVTITGKVDSFTSTSQDIATMTLDNLTARVVSVSDAEELTTLTTGTSKINDFTLTNCDDLTSAALDFDVYTTVVASGSTADSSGDISITGNKKLASLTVHVKSANDIDISNNDALAVIDFPYLATVGGTNPDIDIKDNALTATSVTDNYDATAAGTPIVTGTTDGTTNTGSYTSDSKIGSLQAWIDLAIAAAGTSTLEVWWDTISEQKVVDVNGTVTTTNPGDIAAANQVAAQAGGYYAAVYIVPGITKVSTMDGAIAGATKSYVFDLIRDNLGAVKSLGAGEGFVVTYGALAADTVTFAQDDTARTTVSSLVDYMNADTSLAAANLNIDAALDSAERYVYTVTYLTTTNSINSIGVASGTATKQVYATFGTGNDGALIELTAPIIGGTPNGHVQIAEGFRSDINDHADYNAVSITSGANANASFYVTRNVSGTATVDKSPLMAAAPTLDIVIDAAMASTTAILGANTAGYQTASHLSNTFATSRYSLPDIAPSLQSNLRITLRDTSGLGFAGSVSLTAASLTKSNTAITVSAAGSPDDTDLSDDMNDYLLVDGVSIVSASSNVSSGTTDATATTYYVAAGPNAGTEAVSVDAVTAVTTDRTSWLPASS